MVSSGPVVAEQVVKIEEPRRRMASMAGGPSQLENATRDLFRLSGGQSIPVEARLPPVELKPKVAPAVAARQPDPPPSGRKAEASILFSLESLMKAASSGDKQEEEDPDQHQLWNMQAETPLFGTSQDHALLTTPLDPPPRSHSMDSMTVSSRRPAGMRMPLLLSAVGAGVVMLAGVGWFVLRPSLAQTTAAEAQVLEAPREHAAAAVDEPGVSPEPARAAAAPAPTAAEAPAAAEPSVAVGEPVADAPKEPKGPAEAKPTTAAVKPSAVASRAPTSAKKPPPRPKPAAAPFDKNAAKDALSAAATKAASCGGAAGKGKVQLTFAPSGKVSSAQITEGPFSGTPAGKCALRHFKAAHIPAFAGTPQTVAKSFKIP
jgi:hypothetical protein